MHNSRRKMMSADNIQCDGFQFHVLAVDDSFVDLTAIERLLNLEAFKESGSMALEYLGLSGGEGDTRLEVSMIITDYSMPDMTGFDLLKRIKKSTTLTEMPVVIMSSDNVMARIDRCMEEGAEDFILKPVKLSDVRRLRKYITRGKRL